MIKAELIKFIYLASFVTFVLLLIFFRSLRTVIPCVIVVGIGVLWAFGTMALMDAGVQLKKPVSGIAMGLITDGERYAVLSDILGDEDHLGDMDFKVTVTAD